MTAAVLLALLATPDVEVGRQAMRRADREMSLAAEARDLSRFLSFLTEGAVFMGQGTPAVGREAVRAQWATFFEANGPRLSWQPVEAVVSVSGDVGYTLGTFELSGTDADGRPRRSAGRYVTLWGRQPDGSWKVLVDTGDGGPAHSLTPGLRDTVLRSGASSAGDLRYTAGAWRRDDAPVGDTRRSGTYLLVQRREADGSWTVVVNATPPAPAAPQPTP